MLFRDEQRVRDVKEKYQGLLLSIPGVTGVGIRDVNGLCITVYTENEKTIDLLRELLAREVESVRIEFVEVGRVVALKKVKVKVVNTKSREALIAEAMRENSEYFAFLRQWVGDEEGNRREEEYRRQLEEDLKDYKEGEEIEVDMVKMDGE